MPGPQSRRGRRSHEDFAQLVARDPWERRPAAISAADGALSRASAAIAARAPLPQNLAQSVAPGSADAVPYFFRVVALRGLSSGAR